MPCNYFLAELYFFMFNIPSNFERSISSFVFLLSSGYVYFYILMFFLEFFDDLLADMAYTFSEVSFLYMSR